EAPNLEGSWIHRLTTNYRSGRSIVELFSRSRYQSGVTSAKGNDEHDITLGGEQLSAVNLFTFPAYVPTDEEKRSEHLPASAIIESGVSSVHVLSAVMAVRLALMLATQNAGKRVIIVCPYNKQVRLCESLLEPFNERHPKQGEPGEVRMVEVASVHRYQGGEAEVVIFLLNPSARTQKEGKLWIGNVSLFNDPHLINVGISRAKDVVILLAPEDNMARADYLGYHLMDDVMTREVTDGLDVAWTTCVELEPKLFGRAGLTDRIAVLPLRHMDVLRTQESQQAGNDLVVMHNKSNLNLIVLRDLLMEGIEQHEGKEAGTEA
ncbi:MAG: hypothetical protein KDC03_19535, partial [Flavobacteriales bacterium]|nr:hypothetical protein [Flavobacteriales bacterium]